MDSELSVAKPVCKYCHFLARLDACTGNRAPVCIPLLLRRTSLRYLRGFKLRERFLQEFCRLSRQKTAEKFVKLVSHFRLYFNVTLLNGSPNVV